MNFLRDAGLAMALLFNNAGAIGAAQAAGPLPATNNTAAKAPAPPPVQEDPIYNLNLFEFKSVVLEAKKPVLLDLWAPWCKPCTRLEAELKKVAADQPDLKIVKLNYDEVVAVYHYLDEKNLKTAQKADEFLTTFELIRSLPALAYFKDGKLVAINEELSVEKQNGKDVYFGNGHHMTDAEFAAAPKDAKGYAIEPGEPVNTEAAINTWLKHLADGDLYPASQSLPEQEKKPVALPPQPAPL